MEQGSTKKGTLIHVILIYNLNALSLQVFLYQVQQKSKFRKLFLHPYTFLLISVEVSEV